LKVTAAAVTLIVTCCLLVSSAAAAVVASPVYIGEWGSEGSAPGQFYEPLSVASSPTGDVYVADGGNSRVQRFSADGVYLGQWGTRGVGPGQMLFPSGITVGAENDVYVVDNETDRVERFSPEGAFIAQWGEAGSGDGQFYYPTRIASDSSGDLYVVDSRNNRIEKFSASGEYLGQWGSLGNAAGEFNYPVAVAAGSADHIYVSDYSPRVQEFTRTGTFLAQWAGGGSWESRFTYPNGLATDSSEHIYVADLSSLMEEFDAGGAFLVKWGESGDGDGQFSDLQGVATDEAGNIYVLDAGSHDVVEKFAYPPVVYSAAPAYGRASGGDRVTITGSHLGEATRVAFGAIPASFESLSPATLVAIAPAGTGTAAITVTTPAGTSEPVGAATFTYVNVEGIPEIWKMTPKKGSALGGSTIVLSGNNLDGITSVRVGGEPATEVQNVSNTRVTAVTPEGTSGPQAVTVSTPYGTNVVTSITSFKYTGPTIDALVPNRGGRGGGGTITVSGTGFAPGVNTTTFKFGKATASHSECLSRTSCTVVVPASAKAATVDVFASANQAKSTKNRPADLYSYE
jgi:hypothetical protein